MEGLTWHAELRNLEWAVQSLIHLMPPGSYEKEIAANAIKGIVQRMRWVGEQVEQNIVPKPPARS